MLYASRCTLMHKSRLRIFAALAVVVAAAFLATSSLRHEVRKTQKPNGSTAAAKAALVDDVSRLNATAIHEIWDIPSDEAAAQSALRELLKQADSAGMHVAIAGARHSMGGQTIAPDGIRVGIELRRASCR